MQRQLHDVLISMLKNWRCVALMGPRQVGKSYLLRDILKNNAGTLLSLDDPQERAEVARDPVSYLERHYSKGKYLFIDEAAKVPEVFSAVKILVDKYDPQPTGICLANSGNYLLLKKIKESLAGRVCLLPIYPLSWQEFCGKTGKPGLIDLLSGNYPKKHAVPASLVSINRMREERMLWGGYPLPALNSDRDTRILWIRDYIRTYVLPLVIEQFNIRETMAFEQISRLGILQTAQFLNVNKLATMVGVSQPTVNNFLHYLEAMMITKRVSIYLTNSLKRLVKHPKFYVCDTAIFNDVDANNYSLQKAVEKQEIGALYETFIFNEIQKTLTNYNIFVNAYTWRTQDHAEVDIVLTGSKALVPIEVKYKKRITHKDCSGLYSFMDDYPEVLHGYIVYPGDEILQMGNKITAVPDWWLLGT